MKKSELLKIIREEIEVILTSAEAQEFFDLDMSKLLDEMMPSEFDKGDAYGDTKKSCAAKGLSWDEAAGKCGPWKPGLQEERPSSGLSQKKKSKIAKDASAGKDIGKKGKGFKKVADKAAEKYGKEAGDAIAAAAMWRNAKR